MKVSRKTLMASFCAVAIVAMLVAPALSLAADETVTGIVSSEGILQAGDGAQYTITDDEKGNNLIKEAGKKVKVLGAVEETGGKKVITVTSYEKME